MKPYEVPTITGLMSAIDVIQSSSNQQPKSSDTMDDSSFQEGAGVYADWE